MRCNNSGWYIVHDADAWLEFIRRRSTAFAALFIPTSTQQLKKAKGKRKNCAERERGNSLTSRPPCRSLSSRFWGQKRHRRWPSLSRTVSWPLIPKLWLKLKPLRRSVSLLLLLLFFCFCFFTYYFANYTLSAILNFISVYMSLTHLTRIQMIHILKCFVRVFLLS